MLATLTIAAMVIAVAPSDSTGGVAVSVSVNGDGSCRVEGRFRARASIDEAWRLLTDYENLTQHAPSLGKSRVTRRDGGRLLVAQESVVRAWVFSRRIRVVLDVVEEPPRAIRFKDVSGADFSRYEGAWRLEPFEGGVEVSYLLEAKQQFAAPDAVALAVARDSASKLLLEVQQALKHARISNSLRIEARALDERVAQRAK
jgi:hypothetical protein